MVLRSLCACSLLFVLVLSQSQTFNYNWPAGFSPPASITSVSGGYRFVGSSQTESGGCIGGPSASCAYCATNSAGSCIDTTPAPRFQARVTFKIKIPYKCGNSNQARVITLAQESFDEFANSGTAGWVPTTTSAQFAQSTASGSLCNGAQTPTLNTNSPIVFEVSFSSNNAGIGLRFNPGFAFNGGSVINLGTTPAVSSSGTIPVATPSPSSPSSPSAPAPAPSSPSPSGSCPAAASNLARPSPAISDPNCGAGCTCSQWELASSTLGEVTNSWKWTETNKCKFQISWIAICMPPDAVIGSFTFDDGCRWNIVRLDQNTNNFPPCVGYKFEMQSAEPCGAGGASRSISFQTVGSFRPNQWTFYQHAGQSQYIDPVSVDTSGCRPPAPPPTPSTAAPTSATSRATEAATSATSPSSAATPPPAASTPASPTEAPATTPGSPPATQPPAAPASSTTRAQNQQGSTRAPVTTTTRAPTEPVTNTLPATPSPTVVRNNEPQCERPGYAYPDCFNCTDVSAVGEAFCVPTGAPGRYVYTIVATGSQPPAGALPRASDSLFNCDCSVRPRTCPSGCTGDRCICRNGECVTDPVCQRTTRAAALPTQAPPPPGETNPPAPSPSNCPGCPTTALGVCNGAGVCDSCDGRCTCASGFSGDSCEQEVREPGCWQQNGCGACLFSAANTFDCGFCFGQQEGCIPADGLCNDLSPPRTACVAAASFVPPSCPNNCTNEESGVCGTDAATNITLCICRAGHHGLDCSLVGGMNVAALAGAISGGVIAAIVIVGAVVLVVVVIGTKKAVDWAMLNNVAMSNSNTSPIFIDPHGEHTNPAFDANIPNANANPPFK